MEATAPDLGRLREEIRQTKPFESVEQEALLGLLRTADEARRIINETVGVQDLSLQQYNVLRILRGAASAGLPTLDIAGRMIERTPGITRLVDKLEAKGLITRKRGPDDRRQVFCWITESGLAALSALEEPVRDAVRRSLAGLDQDELARLIGLLDRIRLAGEQ